MMLHSGKYFNNVLLRSESQKNLILGTNKRLRIVDFDLILLNIKRGHTVRSKIMRYL